MAGIVESTGSDATRLAWRVLHNGGLVVCALSDDAAVSAGSASVSMGRIKHTQPWKSHVGSAQRLQSLAAVAKITERWALQSPIGKRAKNRDNGFGVVPVRW